jgi:hypothetical protein
MSLIKVFSRNSLSRLCSVLLADKTYAASVRRLKISGFEQRAASATAVIFCRHPTSATTTLLTTTTIINDKPSNPTHAFAISQLTDRLPKISFVLRIWGCAEEVGERSKAEPI